jgi:hypothetical protein
MSASMFGPRQVGALFAIFLAFALFTIFVSVERAVAWPADRDPLFAQCGLEGLPPTPTKEKRVALRHHRQEEGRSAIAFQRWLASAPPVLPGLLAFGAKPGRWPDAALFAAADQTARYCPSGAQL